MLPFIYRQYGYLEKRRQISETRLPRIFSFFELFLTLKKEEETKTATHRSCRFVCFHQGVSCTCIWIQLMPKFFFYDLVRFSKLHSLYLVGCTCSCIFWQRLELDKSLYYARLFVPTVHLLLVFEVFSQPFSIKSLQIRTIIVLLTLTFLARVCLIIVMLHRQLR